MITIIDLYSAVRSLLQRRWTMHFVWQLAYVCMLAWCDKKTNNETCNSAKLLTMRLIVLSAALSWFIVCKVCSEYQSLKDDRVSKYVRDNPTWNPFTLDVFGFSMLTLSVPPQLTSVTSQFPLSPLMFVLYVMLFIYSCESVNSRKFQLFHETCLCCWYRTSRGRQWCACSVVYLL